MYADDILIFDTFTIPEIQLIKQIMFKYKQKLGQKFNLAKLQFLITWGYITCYESWQFQILHVPCTFTFLAYLGIPSVSSRAVADTFEPLIQRIQKRLAGWKLVVLSRAGRQVLVGSVISAMPTHVMSTRLMPVKVLEKNDKLRWDFLWAHDDQDKHKLHFFNWNVATNKKLAGGLGLKDLQMQNLALLGKKAWKIV